MNTYTGGENNLLPRLQQNIQRAEQMDMIVSFIRDSGVKYIVNDLKKAVDRGAKIRLLTSTYLNVTEPNALYRLKKELNDKIDIKIYNENTRSFHPKTYIFDYGKNQGDVVIGSSNISRSALVDGIEWNYVIDKEEKEKDYNYFSSEFEKLYEENSFDLTLEWLRKYEKNYKKKVFEPQTNIMPQDNDKSEVEPIKFQIPALYELSKTREEGFDKAMVIVATGLGKTYLSAFDTLKFEKVLFVAHRDEILKQSMKTFKTVHKEKSMGFFNADNKNTDKDIVFASISTLGKEEYLNDNFFKEDYFDYIVIDEFHHAGAKSYERLLEYFKPKFLLGITATPDRMDNKDVYKICDYNIAYECNFKTGINNGWLVPFEYMGIYDDTDYEAIPWRNGKYDMQSLENKLMVENRAKEILKKYNNYGKNKTIGFCASIKHCDFMEQYFIKNKIRAKSIHSETSNRQEVIEGFKNGEIDVLFVVDIFNEGVDIPSIDTVLFLRPTESYTIFIQQLGRGLRTFNGKEKLTVLDFVGNYKGSELKAAYLMGDYSPRNVKNKKIVPTDSDYILPDGCNVNFDLRLVDYFKETLKKKEPLKEKLMNEYNKVKEILGKAPTIMDMYERSNYPVHVYLKTFKSWYKFLEGANDLTNTQLKWKDTIVEELLMEIEKTSMSKSYKIPTILSFIQESKLQSAVSLEVIGENFKDFYSDDLHGKDLNNKKHKNWREWDKTKFKKLALDMPVKFLSKGKSNKFFDYDSEKEVFYLTNGLHSYINDFNNELYYEVKDRLIYRNASYFSRKYMEDEND